MKTCTFPTQTESHPSLHEEIIRVRARIEYVTPPVCGEQATHEGGGIALCAIHAIVMEKLSNGRVQVSELSATTAARKERED